MVARIIVDVFAYVSGDCLLKPCVWFVCMVVWLTVVSHGMNTRSRAAIVAPLSLSPAIIHNIHKAV